MLYMTPAIVILSIVLLLYTSQCNYQASNYKLCPTRAGANVPYVQETKWYGEDEYRVGKCVVLAAGRSIPGPGVVKQRGEAVT